MADFEEKCETKDYVDKWYFQSHLFYVRCLILTKINLLVLKRKTTMTSEICKSLHRLCKWVTGCSTDKQGEIWASEIRELFSLPQYVLINFLK